MICVNLPMTHPLDLVYVSLHLPYSTIEKQPNVGKYTIHGWYGLLDERRSTNERRIRIAIASIASFVGSKPAKCSTNSSQVISSVACIYIYTYICHGSSRCVKFLPTFVVGFVFVNDFRHEQSTHNSQGRFRYIYPTIHGTGIFTLHLPLFSTVKIHAWKAKCPIFKAIVAGFRGKVALENRTLGVPG